MLSINPKFPTGILSHFHFREYLAIFHFELAKSDVDFAISIKWLKNIVIKTLGSRTPQIPGSRPGWYGTFYWASDCWPPWQHQVERSLVCVEGQGRISRSGLTQDIKMGSCVFQCDVPHQRLAQRQVGPVSVYCDGVGCRVLCLRHGISVWQHIGQSTTATSRHRRDMTSDVSKRR